MTGEGDMQGREVCRAQLAGVSSPSWAVSKRSLSSQLIGMLAKGFETWVGGLDQMPHETRLICDSEVADVLGFALVTLIEKTSGRESHKSSFIPLPLVPCPLQVAFFEYISSIRGRE